MDYIPITILQYDQQTQKPSSTKMNQMTHKNVLTDPSTEQHHQTHQLESQPQEEPSHYPTANLSMNADSMPVSNDDSIQMKRIQEYQEPSEGPTDFQLNATKNRIVQHQHQKGYKALAKPSNHLTARKKVYL